MVCNEFIEPLNLECILVNTFSGNITIFVFVSYLIIAMLSAYFRITGIALAGIFMLFTTIFLVYIDKGTLTLIVLGLGISLYYIISKYTKN